MKGENTLNISEGNEKLIECLEFIRDTEAAKPVEEMDVDLVNECVAFILELQGRDITLSPEEVAERVSKIPFVDVPEEAQNEKVKRILNKKRVLVIAACLAALIALLCAVSMSSERNVYNIITDFFGSDDKAPEDVWVDLDGQSIILYSDSRCYSSVEEFVEKEKLSVLIPGKTSDIEITEVVLMSQGEKRVVSCLFDKSDLTNEIILNSVIPEEIKDVCTEVITVNEIDCYFCVLEEVSTVQAYFEYNGDTYEFMYNDKQALIDIIENLEEYK